MLQLSNCIFVPPSHKLNTIKSSVSVSDSSTLVSEKSFSDVVYGNGMLYLVSGSMIYKYDIKNNGMRILYRSLNNPQYVTFDATTGYAEFFCY